MCTVIDANGQEKKVERILVSIGHPNAAVTFLPLCLVSLGDKTPQEVAKALRKLVSENLSHFGFSAQFGGFKPSELYWACFLSSDDKKPFLFSDNYYWGVNGVKS